MTPRKYSIFPRSENEFFLLDRQPLNKGKTAQFLFVLFVFSRAFLPLFGISTDYKIRVRWLLWAWYFGGND